MTLEHDVVRAELTAAALELMDTGGLEAVKARVVAQRAGVSVGTLYNLYGNIDGLLEAACARIHGALNRVGETALARISAGIATAEVEGRIDGSARSRLRFMLLELSKIYIRFIDNNEQRWSAVLAFNRGRPAGHLSDWYVGEQNKLIDLIGDALGAAGVGGDAAQRGVVARALWASVHGIVTLSYIGQARDDAFSRTWKQIDALVGLAVDGLFAG